MKISYDREVDALYITLKGHGVAKTERFGPDIAIDFGPDGDIHGIEVLSASEHLKIDPQNAEVVLDHIKASVVRHK